MTQSVFIDGAEGTTGLEIRERLSGRSEYEIIMLDDNCRKDTKARRAALKAADFAILCLPDAAAVDAAAMAGGDTRIIDASSAHRTADGWTYGFAEFRHGQRAAIAGASRVSNPGCYPTGFLALIAPLVAAGLLPADWPYTVNAVSGYSGGGKALIKRFQDDGDIAFRSYGLAMGHKHVPEMTRHAGLSHPPLFAPAVIDAMRGMIVEVPLPLAAMRAAGSVDDLRDCLSAQYRDAALVNVHEGQAPDELLIRKAAAPSDAMKLYLLPSTDGSQLRAIATLDNLCKGASGAAVQNLNIMAGVTETAGLRI